MFPLRHRVILTLQPLFQCDLFSRRYYYRLQVVLRALKQTEQSVEKVRADIERQLTEIQNITEKVPNNNSTCEHIRIIFSLFGNFRCATRSNSDWPFITQFRILLADCRYGNILKRQFYTLTYPIACSSARNLTTNLLCCFGEIWSCDVGLL